MLGLRRRYHRRLGPQQRFLVAAAATIVVVAYVVVPWVSDLLTWSTEALVNAGLFVLLAVVWSMSVSGGRPGGGAR